MKKVHRNICNISVVSPGQHCEVMRKIDVMGVEFDKGPDQPAKADPKELCE